MTAQEESHETKQGQDEDRHEPRFLVSPALKVKSLPADRLLASHRFKIGRRIRSTGFWVVGWSYFVSSDPPMMNFGDGEFQMVEFQMVEFLPAFPYHGAFFFYTNQHGSCWNQ